MSESRASTCYTVFRHQEIFTLSHVNLIIVDNWLVEGKAAIDEVGEEIPTVFSRDCAGYTLDYLNPKGQERLKLSTAQLNELRKNFFDIYIHPKSLRESLPRIREFYLRKDYVLVHSELEKVWYPGEQEYKLCLVNIKLSRAFDGLLTTIQPIEELDYMAGRIRRLGEENEFMVKHYDQFHKLTNREREILRLLAKGMNNPQIAEMLAISRKTVEQHRKNVNKKLGIGSFADVFRYAQAFDLA